VGTLEVEENPLVVTWLLMYKLEVLLAGILLEMTDSSLLFHTASKTSELH